MRCLKPLSILLPVAAGNDPRDDVEGYDIFLDPFAAVSIEGDAYLEQKSFGGLLSHCQDPRRKQCDLLHQQMCTGPGSAVSLDQLIIEIIRFASGECFHRAVPHRS